MDSNCSFQGGGWATLWSKELTLPVLETEAGHLRRCAEGVTARTLSVWDVEEVLETVVMAACHCEYTFKKKKALKLLAFSR